MTRKRGSIALARQLCYEIAGATSEDDDISGSDYGSVDVAEILSAEVERLREALAQPAAQRPWQGLTDEDKLTAVWTDGTFGGGALWAEAMLKERNNG